MALPWLTLELELRIIPGLREIILKAPQEIGGDPLALGCFLEKNHSGDRFAVDPLRYENVQHLLRQGPDFRETALFPIEQRHIKAHLGIVVGM